jgi:hypothetical protein
MKRYRLAPNRVRESWIDFILKFMPFPVQMVTLTIRDGISARAAEREVRKITQRLDELITEKTGRKRRKYRFFQYFVVFDGNEKKVTCIHLLVDVPIDVDVVRRYWNGHWHITDVDNPFPLLGYLVNHIKPGLEPIWYFHKKNNSLTALPQILIEQSVARVS